MKFPNAHIVGPSTHEEISSFLSEWKPSAQREVPLLAQGWIWCHLAQATAKEGDEIEKPAEDREGAREGFEEEGLKLVDGLIERCKEIKATAPQRAQKGVKSQKTLRDEAFAIFGEDIKEIAQKYNVLSGKWLFFPGVENVDLVWTKIVKALADADAPLAKTGCVKTAKVAPVSLDGRTQLICVYVNDSWDKVAVEKALRCLVEDLQLEPSAYKSGAFTILGIDSKHETGIKSSLYSKWDFMKKEEIAAALATKPEEGKSPMKGGKEVKKKTIEDEKAEGLGDFDDVSESEDEEPVKKRQKVNKT